MRILDIKYSITNQLIEVIYTTSLLLPSYINPLLPLLLLLSFFYLNFSITSSNEIFIIKQYLDKKQKFLIFLILNIFLVLFYFCNNEFISPYFYKLYKEKEIDFRNNLKLGVPSENEFHIKENLSIFYNEHDNNTYYDVESILYKDNQFIKSEYSLIELDKNGFNIIFYNGFRIKLNDFEKSKTIFKKFIYKIQNEQIESILLDKEHFNTFELVQSKQKDFYYQGHSRIYHYILFIFILLISDKIILKNKSSRVFYLNLILFLLFLIAYILNSFIIYNLVNEKYSLVYFYLVNIFFLLIIFTFLIKTYETK